MTEQAYRPELIAWVRRTTAAQGVPEHIDGETFTNRIGALFDVEMNTRSITRDRVRDR